MKKIAIALFGEEVSPRFGGSMRFLVSEIGSDGAGAAAVEEADAVSPDRIPAWLESLGVSAVICGGIPRRYQADLEALGIEVIWGVIGPARNALEAYARGTLERDQFLCRGGRRGGRRRRRCCRPQELGDHDPGSKRAGNESKPG
ncbi:MAG: NifB/NifX family molybdenum-iron cluster-binding protein [Planctomycetes bacterium]|nr:NifB/NifX family molybdenum-iron cluster-binding protein [Planctomycetota bacterium]